MTAIKVIFNQEIRRASLISISKEDFTFESLRQLVIKLYPILANIPFQVCYRDDENDLITFSSDEELNEAVEFMLPQSTTLKFTVQTTTNQQQPAEALQPAPQTSLNVYRRVVMPPMQSAPRQPVFQFPTRASRSCIVIKTRVIHSRNGVRKTLAHDLIAMGVGHGSIRRFSSEQVDVMVVLPSNPEIGLYDIARYFALKWSVVKEDYSVEHNNFSEVRYLNHGIYVDKSAIQDPDGRSLDEDLDSTSVDGYSVVSDR